MIFTNSDLRKISIEFEPVDSHFQRQLVRAKIEEIKALLNMFDDVKVREE